MHQHSPPHRQPHRAPRPRFSFAQRGAGFRLAVAAVLVALIWAALLPLVSA